MAGRRRAPHKKSPVAPMPGDGYFAETGARSFFAGLKDDMAETPHFLDTSGLNCPLPVLKARKALNSLKEGERLRVIATDPASVIDFRHFCHVSGYILEKETKTDTEFEYVIVKTTVTTP